MSTVHIDRSTTAAHLVPPGSAMHVESGVLSCVGQKRSVNQDLHVADGDLGLFLVIDGMGSGYARGDRASAIVGETIHAFIADTAHDRDETWPFAFDPRLSYNANRMKAAVGMANLRLAERIRADERSRGMGATITGALLDGGWAVISNVGDCRTYLIREDGIEQLTDDHTWVAEQVRGGLFTQEDANRHPLRHLVTRAVSGIDEQVEVDLRELSIQPADRLLICSDGLHDLLSDSELLDHVNRHADDAQGACAALVAAANERSAPDDVTVVIVRVP